MIPPQAEFRIPIPTLGGISHPDTLRSTNKPGSSCMFEDNRHGRHVSDNSATQDPCLVRPNLQPHFSARKGVHYGKRFY